MLSRLKKRNMLLIIGLLFLSACSVVTYYTLDEKYGAPNPTRYDQPQPAKTGDVSYVHDVKPIVENRCTVCHSCYDAPCQLKMTAWEGIARGANKTPVYDAVRLKEADTTRLFDDAALTSQWRKKDFYAVLNERINTPEANLNGSVMAQLLLLKDAHPLPEDDALPTTFDFSLSRKQQCPKIEEFQQYKKNQPLWGMPFGLPKISDDDQEILLKWLVEGSPREARPALPSATQKTIADWEAFLNGGSLKQQLMSRYIFEHLFLAHIYFSELPKSTAPDQPEFFKLVRSSTPPGQDVKQIATRRPYDDPGVMQVYYRIIPERESIVSKTHMPYRFDQTRKAFWQSLFIDTPQEVTALPSYQIESASNPFITFKDIPEKSRYRFMLDEAQFTVMGFIKGPVCRGDVALNVINDAFWVYFVDPDTFTNDQHIKFIRRESQNLQLPAAQGSDASILDFWLYYSKEEQAYLEAKSKFLNQFFANYKKPGLDLLWDGDGVNNNAALTVFRHFDSASVVKGTIGDEPQSVWVLSYALIERIHYLLVAGYDIYGNTAHQLNTRLYMDFLRMESEFNFLALLPKDSRIAVRNQWYRGASEKTKDFVYGSYAHFNETLSIPLHSNNPKREILSLISQKLSPVLDNQHSLIHITDADLRQKLIHLGNIKGKPLALLPQVTMIKLHQEIKEPVWFTLIHNEAFTNVSQLIDESKRRLPDEDTLTVAYGFIGSYPNTYMEMDENDLPEFTAMVGTLQNETDYANLMSRFGVRRNNKDFWPFSDEVVAAMKTYQGINYGIPDYNRLENR